MTHRCEDGAPCHECGKRLCAPLCAIAHGLAVHRDVRGCSARPRATHGGVAVLPLRHISEAVSVLLVQLGIPEEPIR